MACYKRGGCGVYENRSCSECPASKPEYLNKDKNKEIKTTADCEYCEPPFKYCGQFYIEAGRNNDPYLHIIRKEDSIGGAMIKYCPWCGRELDPLY